MELANNEKVRKRFNVFEIGTDRTRTLSAMVIESSNGIDL